MSLTLGWFWFVFFLIPGEQTEKGISFLGVALPYLYLMLMFFESEKGIKRYFEGIKRILRVSKE